MRGTESCRFKRTCPPPGAGQQVGGRPPRLADPRPQMDRAVAGRRGPRAAPRRCCGIFRTPRSFTSARPRGSAAVLASASHIAPERAMMATHL